MRSQEMSVEQDGEPVLVAAIFGGALVILAGLTLFAVVEISTSQSLAPPMPDRAMRQAQELSSAVSISRIQTGQFPASLSALATGDDGRHPLIESVPLDPWGQGFALVPNAVDANGRPFVVSAGPDGDLFTGDDVGTFPSFYDRGVPYCRVRLARGCWVISADIERRARESIADQAPVVAAD